MQDIYAGYIKRNGELVPHAANVDGVRIELEDVWRQSGAGLSFDDWIAGMLRRAAIVAGGLGNIGEIFWWPLEVPPNDALYCDGRAVSRAEYTDLFGVIGTDFGAGDGETTFNLPDLRNQFIRGHDDRQTRVLGTRQADAMQRITGAFGWNLAWAGRGENVANGSLRATHDPSNSATNNAANANNVRTWRGLNTSLDSAHQTRTADETRPVNINLLPCIRFKVSNTGGGGGLSNFNPRGIWDASVEDYSVGDIVVFEGTGNTYFALGDVPVGTSPADMSWWMVIGLRGPEGERGKQGEPGVDSNAGQFVRVIPDVENIKVLYTGSTDITAAEFNAINGHVMAESGFILLNANANVTGYNFLVLLRNGVIVDARGTANGQLDYQVQWVPVSKGDVIGVIWSGTRFWLPAETIGTSSTGLPSDALLVFAPIKADPVNVTLSHPQLETMRNAILKEVDLRLEEHSCDDDRIIVKLL